MPTPAEFWFVVDQVARERGHLVVGFSASSDQPEIGSTLDNVLGFSTRRPLTITAKSELSDWQEQTEAFYRLRPRWGRGKLGDPDGSYYRVQLNGSSGGNSATAGALPSIASLAPDLSTLTFAGYAEPSQGLRGATFAPRAAASIIDMVVHLLTVRAAAILFGVMLAIASGGRPPVWVLRRLSGSELMLPIAGVLGFFVYQVLCTTVYGSSLGKILLSLQVVQEDGSPCRLKSAIIREAGYLVDALFFGLIGYAAMRGTEQQQRYGDEWANTIVCKRTDVPFKSRKSISRFLLGLMLGMILDVAVLLTAFVVQMSI